MRLAFALLVVVAVAAYASPAKADGYYFTEAVGGAKISDQLSRYAGNGGFNARIAIGRRSGSWAIEGWLSGLAAPGDDSRYGAPAEGTYDDHPGGATLMSYGVDVKYIKSIAKPLEVYLRGGISHGETQRVLEGYAGRGFGVGAGIAVKGKVSALGFLAWPLFFTKWGPRITGALYLENGVDVFRLHRNGDIRDHRAVDARVSRLLFGFALGSDF